jgi:anti-sigma factor RsiW
MRHEDIRAELSELRDGELPPARREELRRHVEGCAACRAELRDWERLAKAFLRRPPAPEPAEAARFVRAVMAHLAELEEPRPTLWERLTAGGSWLTPALGLASAALALSFLPFGRRASAAAAEPLFIADGQEVALAPALAGRALGVEDAVGLADDDR